MSIAVICALQLFIIVLGKFVSKKVMRFLRPIARTTNLLLPFLFVPLGALLLSVMTDKKSSDGLEGIILICATAGIALLMIVFNRDLTEG